INAGILGTLVFERMFLLFVMTVTFLYAVLYSIIGLIIGARASFIFLKIFNPRNMWVNIALKDRLTDEAGYSTVNQEHLGLVGKKGMTLTDLRPAGTIRIEDQDYSAVSNAQWIPKETIVEVESVDGTRILVKESKEQ